MDKPFESGNLLRAIVYEEVAHFGDVGVPGLAGMYSLKDMHSDRELDHSSSLHQGCSSSDRDCRRRWPTSWAPAEGSRWERGKTRRV